MKKFLEWYFTFNTLFWAYIGIGYYLKIWDDYPTATEMMMKCNEDAIDGWKLILNKTKVLSTLLKR